VLHFEFSAWTHFPSVHLLRMRVHDLFSMGQSEKATRRYFAQVEGVRIIHSPYRYDARRRRHVRKYDTFLIPPSVLQREIRKITKSVA
jgi:hypothetical protein